MQLKDLLIDMDILVLNFTWKNKGTRIAKTVLQKNSSNMGGITPPNFKTCCKALPYSRQWLW